MNLFKKLTIVTSIAAASFAGYAFGQDFQWKEATSNGIDLRKSVVLLIGNKIDSKNKREVSTNVGRDYALARGYQYYETSAKTGSGVVNAFDNLFESLHSKAIDIRARYFY